MRRLLCWLIWVVTLGVRGHEWIPLSGNRKVCRHCETIVESGEE